EGNVTLAVADGFTNLGLIELTAQNLSYTTTFAVANGTLVNAPDGVIRTITGSSGSRVLAAELDNDGTLDIQYPLPISRVGAAHVHRSSLALTAANLTVTQSGTTPSFTNLGAITLAAGRTMTVTGGTLDLAGGTLVGDTATLSTNNLSLVMTPTSVRT